MGVCGVHHLFRGTPPNPPDRQHSCQHLKRMMATMSITNILRFSSTLIVGIIKKMVMMVTYPEASKSTFQGFSFRPIFWLSYLCLSLYNVLMYEYVCVLCMYLSIYKVFFKTPRHRPRASGKWCWQESLEAIEGSTGAKL